MKMLMTLKNTLITQYVLCALLPLVILSFFLISSFRSIQIEAQISKQQALSNSVILLSQFALEKASESLLQISRDSNVALAGQSGLFGYSAANALSEYVSDYELVSVSILLDKGRRIVEASPEAALLLDIDQLVKWPSINSINNRLEPTVWFSDQLTLTQSVFQYARGLSGRAPTTQGVIAISAPLFLSETETLDSRSTFTGHVVAFILIEDLLRLIQQNSQSLLLARLVVDNIGYTLDSPALSNNALTTSASMQIPYSDINIQADFYVLEEDALSAVDQLTAEYTIYAAAFVLLFMFLGWLFIRAELKPIDTLNKIVKEYKSGDLSPHNYNVSFYEFQNVVKLLAEMANNISEYQLELESKVAGRTEALEQAVVEVKKINRELIRTQNQLIESEKMSQIGVLVAGVAHEVNTPIGVCVTATSILEERTKVLIEAYEKNKLSKTVLEGFIENTQNCIDILSKNTERAADLIHSFKSISVDQSSEQKRQILIQDYLDLILRSLQTELQRKQVEVELTGQLDTTIETYPGALSQILSNLILNSLKHGFDGEQTSPRQISINVLLSEDNHLDITFKDNGKGVPAESLPKLFEPFYTTGRQSGGSGLGLSIVYNLATQKLGGRINCYCESGSGLTVFIEFPVKVIPLVTEA